LERGNVLKDQIKKGALSEKDQALLGRKSYNVFS